MKNSNGECPRCDDPNGWPCGTCGYRVPANRAPMIASTPEPKPLTKADERTMDDMERRAVERAEERERYL